MNKQFPFAVVGCICGWSGVILQYIATSQLLDVNMIQFLSYFTILTNLMMAVFFTVLLFPTSSLSKTLNTPSKATAITVYILVVGLVYQAVLRQLFHPEGLFLVSDNIVHGLNPLLMLVYWWMVIRGEKLAWNNIGYWVIYPLVFLGYSLLRGAYVHWYPYPFLDVDTFGYATVLTNSAWVSLLFIMLFAMFIRISNRTTKLQH